MTAENKPRQRFRLTYQTQIRVFCHEDSTDHAVHTLWGTLEEAREVAETAEQRIQALVDDEAAAPDILAEEVIAFNRRRPVPSPDGQEEDEMSVYLPAPLGGHSPILLDVEDMATAIADILSKHFPECRYEAVKVEFTAVRGKRAWGKVYEESVSVGFDLQPPLWKWAVCNATKRRIVRWDVCR